MHDKSNKRQTTGLERRCSGSMHDVIGEQKKATMQMQMGQADGARWHSCHLIRTQCGTCRNMRGGSGRLSQFVSNLHACMHALPWCSSSAVHHRIVIACNTAGPAHCIA